MSDKTGISWTDATWNPIRGCSRVSEGCRNCYAERVAARFCDPGQPYAGLIRRGIGGDRIGWSGDVRFVAEHLADPLRWRKPRRIFVNSMSDLFHERLTNEQIAAVFGVMAAASRHTFQVLTKRAKRMCEWFAWVQQESEHPLSTCGREWISAMVPTASRSGAGKAVIGPGATWPLPNVWLGVSVENQDAADERIPELLRTPAAVRFLSCEPLLGPVRLDDGSNGWLTCSGPSDRDDEAECCESRHVNGSCFHGIDWVIAGCESGPGARSCSVEWLRSLRDQCAEAGTAFFLKQATQPGSEAVGGPLITPGHGSKRKPGGVIELPYLDGVQHAAFPEAT